MRFLFFNCNHENDKICNIAFKRFFVCMQYFFLLIFVTERIRVEKTEVKTVREKQSRYFSLRYELVLENNLKKIFALIVSSHH